MIRVCCSVVLSGVVLLGARWGWAQTAATGPEPLASFGVGSFAMTVIAGLLLAFAFQALLTHLSVALGISALPEKAFAPAPKPDREGKEPPSVPVFPVVPEEDVAEDSADEMPEHDAEATPENASEDAPEADVPRQYLFEFTDQEHEKKKKRSLRLLLLTHAVGLWTVLTASLSLFFACLLAVKLSMVTSNSVGVVLGLVVWAGFFCLLFYLEVQSVASVAGSIWSLAIGGIRGSFRAAKGALSSKESLSLEEKLAMGAKAIKEELLDEWDTDELDETIETYIQEQLAAQLAKHRPQEVLAPQGEESQVNVEKLDNRTQQFERDFEFRVVNSKSSTTALFELGKSAIQGYQQLKRRQETCDDGDVVVALPQGSAAPDEGAPQESEETASPSSQEDEPREPEPEEYEEVIAAIEEQEQIQEEVEALIEQSNTQEIEAAQENSVAEDASEPSDESDAPEIEANDAEEEGDEGDASGVEDHDDTDDANDTDDTRARGGEDVSVVEKSKEAIEEVSEAVELIQETAVEKASAFMEGDGSTLEQVKRGGKQALKKVKQGGKKVLKQARRGGKKLTQEVVAQVESLELPDVNVGKIKRDFIKIFKDPMASLQSLKRKLATYDRERIIVLISSNDKIRREDVERIADQIMEAKDEVIQKAQEIEDTVKEKLAEIKQTALDQAEQASRATVSATWWLFATAVVAGVCAALGGLLAL